AEHRARLDPRARSRRARELRHLVRVAVRRDAQAAARVDRAIAREGHLHHRCVRGDDRRNARPPRARARTAATDGPVRIMTPVRVANRRDGGWWWRLPVLAAIWLVLATPIIATGVVATTLRRWARDLPAVPDLAEWRAQAP